MSEYKPVTWRLVPGYARNYQVSDTGRVRSIAHVVWVKNRWGGQHTALRRGKELRVYLDRDGYAYVKLCKDGLVKHRRIARLVLAAFDRPPKACEEAGHKDDDRANNMLPNLLWVTRLQNEQEKTARKRRPESCRKMLTGSNVAVMRDMLAHGFLPQAVAALYSCHHSTVYQIRSGAIWKQNR